MKLRALWIASLLALSLASDASGQSFSTWIQSPSTQNWYSVMVSTWWPPQAAYGQWIGGSLAVIESQAEQDWLVSQSIVSAHPLLFIGPNGAAGSGDWQTPNTAWDFESSSFVTAPGVPISFALWCAPAAPPPTNEHVAVLDTLQNCWMVENGWNTKGRPALIQLVSPDFDLNGRPDLYEIATGVGDMNQNGTLDALEISMNPALDCNANGELDSVEVLDYSFAQDFNTPGVGAPFVLAGAEVVDSQLELTVAGDGGAQFPSTPVYVTSAGVLIEFQFTLSPGPDGFRVTMFPHTGMVSFGHFSIFFDTYQNPWDPDNNHVDLWGGGPILQVPATFALSDNSQHSVSILLVNGTVTMDVTSSTGVTQRFFDQQPVPDITRGIYTLEFSGFNQQSQRIDNIVVTALGVLDDCDGDAIPDDCEFALQGADVNGDGTLDDCQDPPAFVLRAENAERGVAAQSEPQGVSVAVSLADESIGVVWPVSAVSLSLSFAPGPYAVTGATPSQDLVSALGHDPEYFVAVPCDAGIEIGVIFCFTSICALICTTEVDLLDVNFQLDGDAFANVPSPISLPLVWLSDICPTGAIPVTNTLTVGATSVAPLTIDGVVDLHPLFRRGDANGDGAIDISDPVAILLTLFSSASLLECYKAADANDDSEVDISDAVLLLLAMFSEGTTPPAPFTECGVDPTGDALTCASFDGCP